MSRDGAGTYSLPAGNPVVTGTVISTTWANTTLSDVATALTASLAKDGQTTPTANLTLGNFKITLLGAGTAATDAARVGNVQNSTGQLISSVTGTNTITGTTSPTLGAYASGQKFIFVPANTNTGATTINIDSLGAKNVYFNGAALRGGEIKASVPVEIVYDGTQFNIVGALSIGKETINIDAAGMRSRLTNGAAAGLVELSTNKVVVESRDFDASTIEYVQFKINMPKDYNGGTVTARFFWSAASGSGDVVWQLSGRGYADGDDLDAAQGTPQTVTDTLTGANKTQITSETSAITIAGSPAGNRPVRWEASRKASDAADTLGVDARLEGLHIYYTTNAHDDT